MTEARNQAEEMLATFIAVTDIKKQDVPMLRRLCNLYFQAGQLEDPKRANGDQP